MMHLTRVIDRATGYVFIPKAESSRPTTSVPNEYQLFSSATGQLKGQMSDVRDVQERWVDARETWDQWEEGEWRREGETTRIHREKSK